MVKEIIWTKRARRKLLNIANYLEEVWGAKVAENFVTTCFELIEVIAEDLGPMIELGVAT